ncbi:MAG: hypothetical protein VKO21_11935 [Candidatus Sericytochromatia bacterium]|nr:hypothetical protein [Candidatus Sericytochromatia bacterium]
MVTAWLNNTSSLNNTSPLINASPRRLQSARLTATTAADGTFVLRPFNQGTYDLEAVASSTEMVWLGGVTYEGTTPEIGALALRPTGIVTGRLTAPEQPTVTEFEGVDVFIPGSTYLAKADKSGRWTTALGPDGHVYVAGGGSYGEEEAGAGFRVRKVAADGRVSTLAGGGRGYADGVGTAARLGDLLGIAVDADGIVYVTDRDSRTIRQITQDRTVTTIAGMAREGGYAFYQDGFGTEAVLGYPYRLAVGPEGDLYFTDAADGVSRRIE